MTQTKNFDSCSKNKCFTYCFSPDGQFVLAGSADGALFIWNVAKKRVEKVLKEHG